MVFGSEGPAGAWIVLRCAPALLRAGAGSHGAFALCILGNYHRLDNGITVQRDEFATEGLM
jgi:hypothetical protein